jgi:hypothetical protein
MPRPTGDDQLRRLQRMLRPTRADAAHTAGQWDNSAATMRDSFDVLTHDGATHEIKYAAADLSPYRRKEKSSAGGVSLLLIAGGTALVCGMLLLVASNMLLHPAAWRWGFAATIGGQGVIIAAVAAMSARLWRNSRRLNSQLQAVDRRLIEVQATLAESSGGVTTVSLRSALRRLDPPVTLCR